MKQTLALILAVLLLTALCACSEPETNGTEPTAPVPTAVIPTASVPVNSESLPTEDEGPETDPRGDGPSRLLFHRDALRDAPGSRGL